MIVKFEGFDAPMIISDITVTEDRDGYFTAQQVHGLLRAVSRNPLVAVAYVLESTAEALKVLATEVGQDQTNIAEIAKFAVQSPDWAVTNDDEGDLN